MCLAQGHNAVTPVRLESATPRSRDTYSTTEPLRSHHPRLRGPKGHALSRMAAIFDPVPLFGFGFHGVICAKEGPILLSRLCGDFAFKYQH